MNSVSFTVLFTGFLALSVALQFWLAYRQIRHIARHRAQVPADFAEKISLASHQKAADYSITKTQFGQVLLVVEVVVLLALTLFGGLQWLSDLVLSYTGPGMLYQIGLIAAYSVVSGVIGIPLSLYSQFVVEERFGFNNMSIGLFVADLVKSTLLMSALMLPLLWVILTLMEKAGQLWWLYAWAVFCGFQLLVMVLYPNLIAPLFNKFSPLADETLKARIEDLMQRVSFASGGLFVMDGSRRSAHGNAYFSGFGKVKRIVFYDTLLERLEPAEIEAVLAHELGHFKLNHIKKRIALMFVMTLPFLALLGYLKNQVWFYTGLGVDPMALGGTDAMALLLFMLIMPVFTFVFSPLMSIGSRKHEFEADAFAAKHASADDLRNALVKMYDDNASTLTPDPLHSTFYDSHPPASIRIQHLMAN
ncbi:M48 family metallopeptidase [Undibacterium squillarum]|uniref:Peptidase n=1 Tax=Undibacterium squillarum TaxID=1131567 RepID=A0ABQ2XYX4_9BURK|nr:M48 family metallopeptidase [Undibacterium squillarum]GGX44391.1 peptidase [Undibacterium squillarum]